MKLTRARKRGGPEPQLTRIVLSHLRGQAAQPKTSDRYELARTPNNATGHSTLTNPYLSEHPGSQYKAPGHDRLIILSNPLKPAREHSYTHSPREPLVHDRFVLQRRIDTACGLRTV